MKQLREQDHKQGRRRTMKLPMPDTRMTLEQLDGTSWGEPEYDSSLVIDCHRLHRTPLKEFVPGDLSGMIRQNISLEFLVPLGLPLVESDPFFEDGLYPGDLLCALLESDEDFWAIHRGEQAELNSIAEAAMKALENCTEDDLPANPKYVRAAVAHFERSTGTDILAPSQRQT